MANYQINQSVKKEQKLSGTGFNIDDELVGFGRITSPFFRYDNGDRALSHCHLSRFHKNKTFGHGKWRNQPQDK